MIGSPFRSKPWLLTRVRAMMHHLRMARIKVFRNVRFEHGSHVSFARGADVRSPHLIEFGHHVSVGKNFTCEVDLRVGSYVLISSNVSVIGKDHPFDNPELTVYTQHRVDNSCVEIGSDVLIGFGSILVGSITIGDGCIVGAGSVVTRDLPPYTICVGVPARPIRRRFPEPKQPRST